MVVVEQSSLLPSCEEAGLRPVQPGGGDVGRRGLGYSLGISGECSSLHRTFWKAVQGPFRKAEGGIFLEGTLRGTGWAEVRLSACRQHLWGHVFFKDPWGSSSTLLWCAQGWSMRAAWCSSGWSMLGKPEVKWREAEPQQCV